MKIPGARFRAGVLALLAGLLLLTPALVASDGTGRGSPHAHFRIPGQCPKCHLSPGSRQEPARFSTEADSVCLGCHSMGHLGRSHPMKVRPEEKYRKMRVPADLRLDSDGRIMCLTCHTAHGPYVSYFLRRSGPDRGFALLCEACHGKR